MTALAPPPVRNRRPETSADSLEELATLRATTSPTVRRRRERGEPSAWTVWALRLGVVVLGLGLWEAGVRAGFVDPFFWSQPSRIWDTATIAFANGDILSNARFTFTSTVLGFVIGVVGGVTVGLSFWWSRRYALTAEPLFIAFEAMPKLALAPIVVLVLGLGMGSKVAMATALVIVIQVLNTFSAVKAVDKDLTTLMYSLGASRWQVFTKVVVPSTLPWIASSLRVAIGLALTGAIVGEYIGSTAGLGRMIQYAGSTYDIALIWVGVFTLAILSMLLYVVVSWFERRLLKGITHQA
ncbi:ABC transporter permease [Cellulomonas sp. APG4]|uniref:ABC transporter permease n=1 Tax=Cellulomonas sp. APG4 TaxID=1538656 RepID=UPI00137B2BE6|nr:ABC transporter permease [Cellulomonas sp. APG4]NCT91267.1 ABC transporter permease [Cellulomonas sp. APG4]